MPTTYVKGPQLRQILENDSNDCDRKLENIRALLDGNISRKELDSRQTLRASQPTIGVGGGIGGGGGEAGGGGVVDGGEGRGVVADGGGGDGAVNGTDGEVSFDELVNPLTGNDRVLAIELLTDLRKSSAIGWENNTLNLTIDGNSVGFTDIGLLVRKIITGGSPSLPIAITLFISKLIDIKVSPKYFRNGDAQQIRGNLLKIKGGELKDNLDTNDALGVKPEGKSLKRNREEDDEIESDSEKNAKKSRIEETIDRGVKRGRDQGDVELDKENEKRPRIESDIQDDYDIGSDKLKGLRRSPRLKKEILNSWSSKNNGSKSRK